MKEGIPYIIIAVLLCVVFRNCSGPKVETRTFTDTIIVRDTIRDTLLIPQKVYIARTDTVYLPSVADTVFRQVVVPVERKEFRTEDYFAVIEGYSPSLISMEVYPETNYITKTVTNTVKRNPRFSLGVQAGYGYSKEGPAPYVGVGVQYNLWSF